MDAAQEALSVLGTRIRIARADKGWTQRQLAERIGSQQKTISAIESGQPSVAVGTVFKAAAMVGVRLFDAEGDELARLRRRGEETVGLLPRRVRPRELTVDDDF